MTAECAGRPVYRAWTILSDDPAAWPVRGAPNCQAACDLAGRIDTACTAAGYASSMDEEGPEHRMASLEFAIVAAIFSGCRRVFVTCTYPGGQQVLVWGPSNGTGAA